VCQECVVRIDGRLVPACQESVRAGMTIELGGSLA
jgi:predicted molibdopterin-dependent oxidoreductase YjgC